MNLIKKFNLLSLSLLSLLGVGGVRAKEGSITPINQDFIAVKRADSHATIPLEPDFKKVSLVTRTFTAQKALNEVGTKFALMIENAEDCNTYFDSLAGTSNYFVMTLSNINLLNTSANESLNIEDTPYFKKVVATEDSTNAKELHYNNRVYVYGNYKSGAKVIWNLLRYMLGSRKTEEVNLSGVLTIGFYDESKANKAEQLVNGAEKDLYINLDQNYTATDILSSITAKDLFGVDCAVTISEGQETFTPDKIGVYHLTLSATDSYGQSATAKVHIHIYDNTKPVISGNNLTIQGNAKEHINLNYLKSKITATDNGLNHGGSLSLVFTYDGAEVTSSFDKLADSTAVGLHTIGVVARDSSGNEATASYKLSVIDVTMPIFARVDGQAVGAKVTIGVSKTFTMDLTDLTQLYKATDDVDGDITTRIKGKTANDNDFFKNNHKVGKYTLNLSVADTAQNTAYLSVPIEIIADIPPVFIIADTLVYTDTETKLSMNDINLLVTNAILSDKELTSLNVDASKYIGHENEPGLYNITYDYTTAKAVKKSVKRANSSENEIQSGSFDIVVTEPKTDKEKEEEENIFVKIWKGFTGFFERIFNGFKGIFTKFKFDTWITNEEWDKRFPDEEKEIEDSSVKNTTESGEISTEE